MSGIPPAYAGCDPELSLDYGMVEYYSDCPEAILGAAIGGVGMGIMADAYRRTDHWQDKVKLKAVDKFLEWYFGWDDLEESLED